MNNVYQMKSSTHKPQPSQDLNSAKSSRNITHSYQVICERCHKTVVFSGENGEVFPVLCDECAGL